MNNFKYYNPTQLIFGKGSIARLAKLLPSDAKILVTYGGGSVRRNGVYEQVTSALQGFEYSEFWGLESNPTVETIRRAVAQGKEKKSNFVLAVGGGSVIDASKLISAALLRDEDPWQLVLQGIVRDRFVPLGTVLTIPATGSEMNSGAVISSSETKEKFPFHGQFPTFSILDPEVTYTLPPFQLACGIADSYVHVMEQYLTAPGQSRLMDRFAEGILLTLREIAPLVLSGEPNYDARADFMVAATHALNGSINWGVKEDWSTHMIGHELTAIAGLTHAHSLIIVLPSTLRVMSRMGDKHDKMLEYAEHIWGIKEGNDEERIEAAIQATEQFFRSLGLTTRLREAGVSQEVEDEIVRRFTERGVVFGENGTVTPEVVREILADCR
ncbi:iron-containing alcohol dehydrogenase [Porphyromonas endodontalis]|uniref:iron-containing alcohol dehydrogenase n=1 Tax=Porphyromonas endodontalis TaxID=28124 RepID=UPI0028EC10DF|nr:iron-containing alcohol dehydrogenase [Porphyromonas endodontalis]